jgi:hypothetical protein
MISLLTFLIFVHIVRSLPVDNRQSPNNVNLLHWVHVPKASVRHRKTWIFVFGSVYFLIIIIIIIVIMEQYK